MVVRPTLSRHAAVWMRWRLTAVVFVLTVLCSVESQYTLQWFASTDCSGDPTQYTTGQTVACTDITFRSTPASVEVSCGADGKVNDRFWYGSGCPGSAAASTVTDLACERVGSSMSRSGVCSGLSCPTTDPASYIKATETTNRCDGSGGNPTVSKVSYLAMDQCLTNTPWPILLSSTPFTSYRLSCTDDVITAVGYVDDACRTEAGDSYTLMAGDVCIDDGDGDFPQHWRFECGCSQGCFNAATSFVELEDGRSKGLHDVVVGDVVMAVGYDGTLTYDTVFRVGHNEPNTVQSGVRLTTSTGRVLDLTANHFLHVDTCCSPSSLTEAGQVGVGSVLFTVSDKGLVERDVVMAVEPVALHGLVNVHTLSSNIVVNGVAASHFTTATTWTSDWGRSVVAPVWYSALHALNRLAGE